MKMESEPIRLYLWITKEIKRMPFLNHRKDWMKYWKKIKK